MLEDKKSKLLKKLLQISKYVASTPKDQRGDLEVLIEKLLTKLHNNHELTQEILTLESEIETKFIDLMYRSKKPVVVGKEENNN